MKYKEGDEARLRYCLIPDPRGGFCAQFYCPECQCRAKQTSMYHVMFDCGLWVARENEEWRVISVCGSNDKVEDMNKERLMKHVKTLLASTVELS